MRDKSIYQQIARLHISALDQSFLSTLGPAFLALMYQSIDECKNTCLILEEREGQVIGFISGACGVGPIYRKMLHHWFRLTIALAPVILHPAKLWRIIEILSYGREKVSEQGLPEHELISIAVAKQDRGRGVAERLYGRLLEYFRDDGVQAFRITVGDGLAPAHRFYQRMGAVPIAKTSVHRGHFSTIYLQKIKCGA